MGIRDRILELLAQRPFHPFRLVLSNGHTHDVRHPEMLLVSPYYVIVGIPDPKWEGGGAILDSNMVAMIHIAEIVPAPATSSK